MRNKPIFRLNFRSIQIVLLLLFAGLVAACGGPESGEVEPETGEDVSVEAVPGEAADSVEGEDAEADEIMLPTVIQPASVDLDDEANSPRNSRLGASDGLPPTYTPAPESDPLQQVGQPDSGNAANIVADNSTPEPPVSLSGETYTIQEGDTLGEIATEFNVTLDDLLDANSELIENIDEIEVGWVLQIPTAEN